MKRRLRSATILLAAGGAVVVLTLIAMLILQLAGISAGFDVLLSLLGAGALLSILGGLMYAVALSHKKTHRFLSEGHGRTMQAHDGREDRRELEGETGRGV